MYVVSIHCPCSACYHVLSRAIMFTMCHRSQPQAYSNNLIDHHMILDLLPLLAQAYFAGAIPVTLSYGQAAILLALGLQRVDVDVVGQSLGLPTNQVLALFNKLVRRLQGRLQAAQEAEAARGLPSRAPSVAPGVQEDVGLDEELEQGAAVCGECVDSAVTCA